MKTIKITVIALLSLTLAAVSCKKEEAPETNTVVTSTQNEGGNEEEEEESQNSALYFTDLLAGLSSSDTLVYDSTWIMTNEIGYAQDPFDLSGIEIKLDNNGGVSASDLATTGSYDDELSAIEIYNGTTSAWEVYTLDPNASHSIFVDSSNGHEIVLSGTFINTNGDTVVIPLTIIRA